MGFVRTVTREEWKRLGPEGRDRLLVRIMFRSGIVGKHTLVCETWWAYFKRKVRDIWGALLP